MDPNQQPNEPQQQPPLPQQPQPELQQPVASDSFQSLQPVAQPAEQPLQQLPIAPAPTTAIGSATGTSDAFSSDAYKAYAKPKSKVGIIIGSIVGALLLIGGGVFAYFMFFSVGPQDYAAASEQFQKVSSANSTLALSFSTLSRGADSDTDAEFDEALKIVNDDITKLKTESATLGDMKAMRVGDGKPLYDTFKSALDKNLTYVSELVTSYETVRPALVKCGDISGSGAGAVASLKTCADALGTVGDMPSADLKAYIATLHTHYKAYATAFEQRTALAKPFGADYDTYRSLSATMTSSLSAISTATTNFSKAVQDKNDEAGVADAANALKDFLNTKNGV